jgi:hypothetical protein
MALGSLTSFGLQSTSTSNGSLCTGMRARKLQLVLSIYLNSSSIIVGICGGLLCGVDRTGLLLCSIAR